MLCYDPTVCHANSPSALINRRLHNTSYEVPQLACRSRQGVHQNGKLWPAHASKLQ